MNVTDLSREQLSELKGNYLCERNEERGERTFWSDLCDADVLVSDAEIYEAYAATDFCDDDFFCSCYLKRSYV